MKITEAAFQSQVIALARTLGWRVAHFRPAQNARGQWRTAVAGDGKGFPDLVLVGRGRVLFVELKQDSAYPKPEQRQWHNALRDAGADMRVWRPRDWATEVLPTLQGREVKP